MTTAPDLRRDLRAALPAFVWSRALLLIYVSAGMVLFPLSRITPRAPADVSLLDAWQRWDAEWFWRIFSEGYRYDAFSFNSTNFFPVFPWAAGVLSWPLRVCLSPREAFVVAGIALSHVAFLLALAGIYRIGAPRLGATQARRALWLICTFPFSFFFSAVYSESIFLALVVWSLALAQSRRWGWACALAAVAAATRIPGAVIGPALACEYVAQNGLRWRRQAWFLALVPLGVIAIMVFFRVRFGDALLFQRSQANFGERFISLYHPVIAVLRIFGKRPLCYKIYLALQLALLPLALRLVGDVWRRLGAAQTVYALGSLMMAYLTGIPGSGRYVSVLFPLFLAATRYTATRGRFCAIASAGALLQLYFAYWFSHWKPIT